MSKPEHRRAAERRGLRYPSDVTDGEWALVEPMIPPAKPTTTGMNTGTAMPRPGANWQCCYSRHSEWEALG